MSGRPQLQQLAKHIEENGGEEWVFSFVAEGLSMKRVAEKIGASSRGMLYLWIDLDRDKRRRMLEDARKQSADAMAEDGLEILDDLDGAAVTSADVQAANSRANYRKWLATVRNREAYGEPKAGIDVNINVGSLHLDALRKHASAASIPEAVPAEEDDEVIDADYEVIEADKAELVTPTRDDKVELARRAKRDEELLLQEHRIHQEEKQAMEDELSELFA